MSDVVLVYPKTGFDLKKISIHLPLALLSACSIITEDFEVKIIDQRTTPDWEGALEKELKTKPLCVGLTSMTGRQIKYALEVSQFVRNMSPDVPIVWGGVHASLLPEQTAEHVLIDVAIRGEGEQVLRDLVHTLKNGTSLENVKGIAFKRNGEIILTEQADKANLDLLPELPYELVEIDNYLEVQTEHPYGAKRVLPFITSRGCPYQCTFCCNPALTKRVWRSMSAKNAHTRVANMVKRFKLDAVTFHDENFLGNPKRAEEIAELLRNEGITWFIQGRMDGLLRVDLSKLASCGLRSVQPGIESGSERVLKMIKKGESLEKMRQANKQLSRMEIIPTYNFMMGFPTETEEELFQSIDFALELLEDNPRAQLSGFYIFTPYPGSEAFGLAVKDSFTPPTSLDGWIDFGRHNLQSSWVRSRPELFKNILFTSKLVDGVRFKHILKSFGIPSLFTKPVKNIYRNRWKRKDFSYSLDIRIFELISKYFLEW